ncbi:MAG TPA: hypothetical protein VHD83_22760 [Puia sp.]|nr:hypothetical protein [Puia sp.]
MKLLLPPSASLVRWACVLLLLFASCKKSADHSPARSIPVAEDKAKKYIGSYHVTEYSSIYYPPGDTTRTEFAGQIIRDHSTLGSIVPNDLLFTDTINVISFIQSGRDPAPEWVIPGRDINYGSDTITFKVYRDSTSSVGKDTIMSAYGDLALVRVLGKDSLSLSYYFGIGYVTYYINQIWIKN